MSTISKPASAPLLGLLAAGAFLPLAAQDVTFMGVVKGVTHWQSGPSAPIPGPLPYQFNAFADLSAPGRLTTATLTPPGHPALALQAGDNSWDLGDEFASATALDAAFPNGSYTLRLTGVNDGTRTVTLALAGDAYPSVPTLHNFTALQSVPAQEALTVSWQPFAGGTMLDFVQFSIRRSAGEDEVTVFETAQPGQNGGLNGTHTSVTVPAGTLAPGQSYVARLLFAKIVDLDLAAYGQGVPALAAYFRETRLPLATTGNLDVEAPQLWNSSPTATDGPVPRNSGVAFEFSEPMQPGQAIVWGGVDPTKFTYRWSANGRVLFCVYAPQLPAGARVTWKLERNAFRDAAGNALPAEPEGSFTTALADALGVPDITVGGLFKSERFTQVTGAVPQPRGEGGYSAGAFADSSAHNTIIAGSLRLPGGNVVAFEDSFGDGLETETQVNSKTELDAAAPTGTYQLIFETAHQGSRSVSLNVPADAYPSVPEFLNLASAQGLDPTQPFTLNWKAMAGGSAGDFIGLWIEPVGGGDSVFETPEFGTGQHLNGTATGVTIPAGTLKPGRAYQVELEFAHPTTRDTTSLPGSTLVVAYTRLTQATIQTGGAIIPPQLTLTPATNGRWTLRITGDAGVNYVLEATSPLGSGWTPLANFQLFGDAFEFTDGVLTGQRFYRVREGF